MTYTDEDREVLRDKEIVWLHGEIKMPPFSVKARAEAGFFLRQLQNGKTLTMPQSHPMPVVGARCHELRIQDRDLYWRIIYRVDEDAIVVAEVFAKKTQETPFTVINNSRKRLAAHDRRHL